MPMIVYVIHRMSFVAPTSSYVMHMSSYVILDVLRDSYDFLRNANDVLHDSYDVIRGADDSFS